MKLLEKDIHEKQDTIISLRRQLDEIKVINLEMYRKLQVISFLCRPYISLSSVEVFHKANNFLHPLQSSSLISLTLFPLIELLRL